HVGHGRNYILGDVVTRLKTMQGHQVLSPMGWDAFGLPAENAAIANRIHPAVWTKRNIARMKEQLLSWGVVYDWNREIASCDPEYYRWTQWIFLQLYKRGLAYRSKSAVNWCPVDQTVLANEQVVDGRCERCGSEVVMRELEQWFFRITEYAEPLLRDLETLPHWPEKVRVMQANWIGRSEGATVRFPVPDGEPIEIFTTRPDTLYGATFLVLAAEHPLVWNLQERGILPPAAAAFVDRLRRHRVENRFAVETDKEGCPAGIEAIHPLTGKPVPVWVANYVLMGYGTGAIMAVPAHDQRDYDFAVAFDLPIQQVVAPADGSETEGPFVTHSEGEVLVHSGEFTGLTAVAAKDAIIDWLDQQGRGHRSINYRLRDWLLSRQRYWGAPIPIVYCDKCGIVPVPE
ncbi:MAG TPA: leucine--tRNA ligase, partial [Candidatus Eisenbacteria bacterium]|nr:leucine--tRNA ligase [Candidatus Eisenbacteria bacterium]